MLRKNRILNAFGTLALGGAVLLGGVNLAHATPGGQDDWNKLFQNSTITNNTTPPQGNVYTHAEGRDPSELLSIHGDWEITSNAIVNGKVSLGDPNAPAYIPGNLSVENNSTLKVTGSLATQGELTLGEELEIGSGKNGTLILEGASKDSTTLDISGTVTVGRDGKGVNIAFVPISYGGDGNLHLRTGIATFGGDLNVGGSSGHVTIPTIDYEIVPQGQGGKGTLTVDKDAELHMQAGSYVKFGGDASSGYNIPLPVIGFPIAVGSPGGDATVTSSGYMRLGHVTMGGDAGSAANAMGVIPSLTMFGGFGGDADMTLHKGSVTVMESLKAGGAGGNGGDGGDALPAVPGGFGGIGGHGGYAKITVNGSLTINGATVLGAEHGSMGGNGSSAPNPPAPDMIGGIGGILGYAGYGRSTVTDGGSITLGNSITSNHHVEISTDLIEAALLLAGQPVSDSYLEIGQGGTLKLTDTQNRDLVYSSYFFGAHKGLDASGLISDSSSGTIRMTGGTVEGKDLSASEGLALGTGSGEVDAHIVTDRFTIGTKSDAKSITISDGLSLKITGTSEYLLSSDAEAVKLQGGTLDVGGDIALMASNKVTLIKAGYGSASQDVGLDGTSANHVITQGKALAGDAPVNIAHGSSVTAKTLDTTTKLDGTHVADGQSVAVSGAGSTLHLTQDVSQGSVIKLGNTGTLLVDAGALKLTGDVTMGKIGVSGGNSTLGSLTGVQQNTATNTITFANEGALQVSGVLNYGGTLTVGGVALDDVFSGNIIAGGINASALHVNGGTVALTGFERERERERERARAVPSSTLLRWWIMGA